MTECVRPNKIRVKAILKRPHYIASSSVLLLVLVLLNLPSQTAAHLKLAISGLFLPLFRLATSTHSLAENTGQTIIPRRLLLRELEGLRRENDRLRVLSLQSTQVWTENERLRDALQWQKQSAWKIKLARVILRDPANWWRTLRIDLGSRDGIQPNMPVLTADGLVGRIQQVGSGSSQVILLGDPNLKVAALVQRTGDAGMAGASAGSALEQSLIELTFLPPQTQARPGDLVVTSGLEGFFPRGLPIGKVVDKRSVNGMYIEARIQLLADLAHLDEVWIKFP